MNRKALNLFKLIPAVAILAASGLSAMTKTENVHADGVSAVGTAYTLIDTKKENIIYEKVLGWYADEEPYQGEHAIIGFNTPGAAVEIASIERLSIGIYYNHYADLDLLKLWPQKRYEEFMIKSSDTLSLMDRPKADSFDWPFNETPLPLIGTYSALSIYDSSTPYGMIYQKNGIAFTSNDFVSVDVTKLNTCTWYVVLPVSYTLEEIIISIAATDVNGGIISDGTDDGIPFTDPDYGNYISMSNETARSVHFMGVSTITRIAVENYTGGTIFIKFGDYDYTDNSWPQYIKGYEITENTALNEEIIIPASYECVVTYVGGTADIKIFYESDSLAVLSNVVGWDGTEQPHITDPEPPKPDWLLKLEKFLQQLLIVVSGLGLLAIAAFVTIKVYESQPTKSGKKT